MKVLENTNHRAVPGPRQNLASPLSCLCLALLVLLPVLTPGCQSARRDGPGAHAHAWVKVTTTDITLVRQTIKEVFTLDYYKPHEEGMSRMVYDKPGSRMDSITYGSFFEKDVWVRVKINIRPYLNDAYVIEATAYAVRHHGDSFFEEENKLMRVRRKPFQKLLDQVEERLAKGTPL